MPLSPEVEAARKLEAVQMQAESTKHNVRLSEFSSRFKCSNQEAFNVLRGIDLDSDLRDKMWQYLLGEPGKGLRAGHGNPNPPPKVAPPAAADTMHPAKPVPPQVVDLISRPGDRGKAERPPIGQPYQPPKPDPVPEPKVELRQEATTIAQPGENILAPIEPPATPPSAPAPVPAPPAPAAAPAAVHSGNRAVVADPEVGARIRVAMEAAGYTAGTFGKEILNHASGSNVSAALGRSGSRSLQDRMCDLLALDHKGHPIPGKVHSLPLPGTKKPAPAPEPMKPDVATFLKPEPAVVAKMPAPQPAQALPSIPEADARIKANRKEIGERITAAIEQSGSTLRLVAWHLGYQTPANISACIKGGHAPELRKRLCALLGLDRNGYRDPAIERTLPHPQDIKPPEIQIDPAKAVSAERMKEIADALGILGETSEHLKATAADYQEAQNRYKKALAAVQRLGISVSGLRAA